MITYLQSLEIEAYRFLYGACNELVLVIKLTEYINQLIRQEFNTTVKKPEMLQHLWQ
ncbi:MAG TPA: hypothetical protein VNS32_22950 [Flavisolibacter sp.]|nr:hypothetical protein [Flavisolibacter sp.]